MIDMPGKLTKNKKIRKAHREHAKKVLAAVDEALSEFDGSVVAKDKVTRIIITFNDKLATLKSLDESILEPNIVTEVEESEEFCAQIHAALVKLQRCQTSKNESTVPLQSNPSVSTQPVNAKLPKLQIKKFTGDPKEWQSFWDSFSSAVHTNKALKNVDKLNYLKSLLEGAALSAITGLALTEPNYANAVDILKERFGNKQLIVSSHMEALLKLKPVTALSDIKGMRAVLDKVEIQVRGLQALGIESDQYGALLIPIFMEKLPDELRLIASREHKDDWKLDSVLQAVKSEVEARERCNIRPSTERPPVKKPYPTGSASLSGNRGEFNCLFCKGAHRASDCRVVTNVDQRKDILKKQGRCFICLCRGGHIHGPQL